MPNSGVFIRSRTVYQSGLHAKGESGEGCRHRKPSAQLAGPCGSQAGLHNHASQTFSWLQGGRPFPHGSIHSIHTSPGCGGLVSAQHSRPSEQGTSWQLGPYTFAQTAISASIVTHCCPVGHPRFLHVGRQMGAGRVSAQKKPSGHSAGVAFRRHGRPHQLELWPPHTNPAEQECSLSLGSASQLSPS